MLIAEKKMIPAIRADLMLVGHGVRGPCAPAAIGVHKDLLAQLRETGQFNEIRWGYLTCEPRIESVLDNFKSETVYILPMLMCDGYFSRVAIPDKLDLENKTSLLSTGQKVVQCLPVGLSTMMADLMTDHMVAYCLENNLAAQETSVVVIGHGSSKDDASSMAISMQVEHIRHREKFNCVYPAFLEEAPDLPTVLKTLKGPVLVIGYFANCGNHAIKDVAAMIRESNTDAIYLGPVGTLPAVKDVVLDCVSQTEE